MHILTNKSLRATFEWDEPFFDGSMTIGAKGPQECSLLGNSKNTSWLNYVVKPGSYDGLVFL